jgi:iron complex outermembrane recepter protein
MAVSPPRQRDRILFGVFGVAAEACVLVGGYMFTSKFNTSCGSAKILGAKYLGTSGIAAVLIAGFNFNPAFAQQAPRDVLPDVRVQSDRSTPASRVNKPAAGTPTATRRRAARSTRTASAPAQPTASPAAGAVLRDGIDGYFANATSAGTKMSTPILSLPRAVSTITAQDISDREAQSVREAMQYTAGVNTYFREGQFTRDYGIIRGFQGLQFLDGLRLNVSNYGLEPYGLERVDVLKGPAATLYGQGSPGGLWDMTSKRPTDQAFAEMLLRAGSYNFTQAAFDVGGPVNADHSLLYRFVGLGTMGDGQIDFAKNERVYLAPSVTWRPNEDTSLTILAAYQNDPHVTVLQPLPYKGTIVPGPTGQFISRSLFLGEPNYHDTFVEQERIGYELKHQFNDVFSFQQNFGYQHILIGLNEVQSLTNPNTTFTSRNMSNQVQIIDMLQIDNRFKADFDMGILRHHAILGIDYSAVPNYQGTGLNTATPYTLNLHNPVYGQPLATSNPVTTNRYQDQRQAGVYVQDRIELGRLSFLGGVREDELVQGQKTRTLNLGTGVLSNPAWTIQQDSAFTTNAGFIYTFANGLAPYISYSETFTPTIGTDFTGAAFVPTTGNQTEAGVKYKPVGYELLVTAAVFDISQNNVLTPDPNPLHRGFSVQTSSVRSTGAELEIKTTYLYGFNINAAYTYLDAKVVSTNTAGVLGKHPVATPADQASLWTTYRFAGGALAGLTLGGGVRFVGDQAVDPQNTLAIPSFTLFDLMASYQLGALSPALKNWDVALNVKNLADKRYVGSCDDAVDCYYGPGRNITGTIRARF